MYDDLDNATPVPVWVLNRNARWTDGHALLVRDGRVLVAYHAAKGMICRWLAERFVQPRLSE